MNWIPALFLLLSATHVLAIEGARREVYKTMGATELALHVFEPEGHASTETRAAAVFFFGGGWNGGTPSQFVPHARYLASRGMVTMVAEYRTRSQHEATPFDCVADAKSAIRWMRAHAKALGIDPERIAAGGGSAGGHLAAATATVEGLDDGRDDLSVSAVPNALLLFNPVYDNGPGGYGHDRVGERFEEISPYHNIRKGMPPAITFLGTRDRLIPVETAKRFQEKMRSVGSTSALFLYEDQGHGFFNHQDFRPGASPDFYYRTMLETDRFLVGLGFLEGSATLQAPHYHFALAADEKQLDILYNGRPLAAWMHAFDPSSETSRHDTYKPFLHVYDPKGTRFITKGAGGQFTHHRGIFLGFSKIMVNGKRYDLWHMKEGVQVHRALSIEAATETEAAFTASIAWQDNQGEILLSEDRRFRFLEPPAKAYALIEMTSALTAVAGDAEMSGDPEHAGAQFRPANDIVAKETVYAFHQDGIDPKKDLDLPWVGETFRLEPKTNRYSVVILNHPDNPKGTVFSAYRDYGRFGAFPSFTIQQGETATLRYRWIVTAGNQLATETIEQALAAFHQS